MKINYLKEAYFKDVTQRKDSKLSAAERLAKTANEIILKEKIDNIPEKDIYDCIKQYNVKLLQKNVPAASLDFQLWNTIHGIHGIEYKFPYHLHLQNDPYYDVRFKDYSEFIGLVKTNNCIIVHLCYTVIIDFDLDPIYILSRYTDEDLFSLWKTIKSTPTEKIRDTYSIDPLYKLVQNINNIIKYEKFSYGADVDEFLSKSINPAVDYVHCCREILKQKHLNPKDFNNYGRNDESLLKFILDDNFKKRLKESINKFKKVLEDNFQVPFEIELYLIPAVFGFRVANGTQKYSDYGKKILFFSTGTQQIYESYFNDVTVKKDKSSKQDVMKNVAKIATVETNKRKVKEYFESPNILPTLAALTSEVYEILADCSFFRINSNDESFYVSPNIIKTPKNKMCSGTNIIGTKIYSPNRMIALSLDNYFHKHSWFYPDGENGDILFLSNPPIKPTGQGIDIVNNKTNIRIKIYYIGNFFCSDAEYSFQALNNIYYAEKTGSINPKTDPELCVFTPEYMKKCKEEKSNIANKDINFISSVVNRWGFSLDFKDLLDELGFKREDVFCTGSDDFMLKMTLDKSKLASLKHDVENIKNYLEKKYHLPFSIELDFISRLRSKSGTGSRITGARTLEQPFGNSKIIPIVTV